MAPDSILAKEHELYDLWNTWEPVGDWLSGLNHPSYEFEH